MPTLSQELPTDIPWVLVNTSEDMMDKTFCDKKLPSPFRSSVSLYTYEPSSTEIPEEYAKCGKQITYLKVSCSITGYQPSLEDQSQIIDLMTSIEGVDYSKIDDVIREYFGCYGVLLNISVHPDKKDKDNLDKYPHIIDFEPKTRDFYQSASETGEVLSTSTNKLTTTKSYSSVDNTENSWESGASIEIPSEAMTAMTGIPAKIGLNGKTGHARKETDQANWSVAVDSSNDRKETQATTTQLNQMYNLLTGYHTGTNRASFIMLPRPHILQPTNRRTFVQGLRVIEGIQDFFLIVLREKDQPTLNVDILLQTGHFSENINIPNPSNESKFESTSFTIQIEDSMNASDTQTIFGDGYKTEKKSKLRDVVDESNGWEADPSKGDAGHGGVREIRKDGTVTITEIDTETGQVLATREVENASESGVSEVDYAIDNGKLIVSYTLKARRKNLFGSYGIATFSRAYEIFLRRKKINNTIPVADLAGLLITQRKLCTQISLGDCLSGKDVTNKKLVDTTLVDSQDNVLDGIVAELPFDISHIFDLPRIHTSEIEARSDFGFKMGIIRMIQSSMLSATNSMQVDVRSSFNYVQSDHFQKRLLQVLPSEILELPIGRVEFVHPQIKSKNDKTILLRELLSSSEFELQKKYGVSKNQVLKFEK